ncbi:gp18 [Listeria phage P40]|uniref:holin n=1 Tax=Listeria phage P40 TaxID=560178 RepID=UPI00018198D8|nr:holin [Listeria phage P40]ACI00378.1 gp18 [Listeria phage P40]
MGELNLLLLDSSNALLHNIYFFTLVGLIAFDYLTGVLKASIWKVADSSAGFKGLVKHSLVILGFAGAYMVADAYNFANVITILAGLYSMNYLLSILENFAVMGIFVPKFLLTRVKAEIKRFEGQLEEQDIIPKTHKYSSKNTSTIDLDTKG